MADTKVTALTANTTPATTDVMYLVDDPGGSPLSQKITLQNLRAQLFPHAACGGRLTLTTGVPVTTADVTAAATLYFTPYSGSQFCGQIGLYDGSAKWDVLDFTELSLSLAGYTASKPYDIWCYNNSGTPTLDSTVWTNTTTRATALTTQDGIYVKTGATTRRYLGTIYINSSGAQTDDSVTKRNVFNYYNRVPSRLYRLDSNTHTYNSTTWRYWNNDSTQIFEYMCGVVEGRIQLSLEANMAPTNVASPAQVNITLDGATTVDATTPVLLNGIVGSINYGSSMTVLPSLGYHFYSLMERVQAGSTNANFSQIKASGMTWG